MLLMNIEDQRLELLHPRLKKTITQLLHSVDSIPAERKAVLDAFAKLIPPSSTSKTKLIFVCTHNSRRSHATMLWAHLAAYLSGRTDIQTYSGGTEVTAFNYRAIAALERAGFLAKVANGDNPPVEIGFGNTLP